MAIQPESSIFTGQEIAEAKDIPKGYLLKILRILKRNKILISVRGPHGGFSLARAKKDIFLKEIVFSIDEPESFTNCALGMPGCTCERPCPLHAPLSKMKEEFLSFLTNTTLADLSTLAKQSGN